MSIDIDQERGCQNAHIPWVFGLFCMAWLGIATAKDTVPVYKYRDAQGVLHLTSRPPPQNVTVLTQRRYPLPPQKPLVPPTIPALPKITSDDPALLILATAFRHRLDPALLRAVVRVESNFNARAVSPKGAQGLMQLMPATARAMGVREVFDPAENLEGGAKFLRQLLTTFDQDVTLALAAYNAGEYAVRKHGNQIPPYPETQGYVREVLAHYRQNLGNAAWMLGK